MQESLAPMIPLVLTPNRLYLTVYQFQLACQQYFLYYNEKLNF
jgi:hypothetical protein